MISDKTIRDIFVNHGFHLYGSTAPDARGGEDLRPYVYIAARTLIAEAIKVKPLEFERDGDGDLVAHCSYGVYLIVNGWVQFQLFVGSELPGHIDSDKTTPFSSEQYAVEVAQDIHKAKILRELVHGGGE